jgi:hypothetical protein
LRQIELKRTASWASRIMKQFVIKPKCCEYGQRSKN